ncbi:MAG: hypothetical protein AAF485_08820, partial [Chloroflexota bacterium]
MSNVANSQTEMTLAEAKEKIIAYCKKRGALAVGVADVEILERIAPPGHGPRALMPRVQYALWPMKPTTSAVHSSS